MTREEFMAKARGTTKQILEGKENGIMNLVQQAWAEGKRNAEVEGIREAIEEALTKREKPKFSWCGPADAHTMTWKWFLLMFGLITYVPGENYAFLPYGSFDRFELKREMLEKLVPEEIVKAVDEITTKKE